MAIEQAREYLKAWGCADQIIEAGAFQRNGGVSGQSAGYGGSADRENLVVLGAGSAGAGRDGRGIRRSTMRNIRRFSM